MDFHRMKRKDLQIHCKRHHIPANLKNVEMANRLASLFQKESVKETEISVEDCVEDDVVVSKEGKKVTFSPENEVFEFTRSVKKPYVRRRSLGPRQGSCREVRRSKRTKAKTVDDFTESESSLGSEFVKDMSEGLLGDHQDGLNVDKVRRRSTRLMANLVESCVGGETLKVETLLPAKRRKKEDEIGKTNVKEVYVDFEVQETGKYHMKDLPEDSKVEKVPRQSGRLVNDIDMQTNIQVPRRSTRLKTSTGNPSMGDGTSDGRPVCSDKGSKEERKAKQSKGYVAVNNKKCELVKNKSREPLIDCKVQTTEKVQDVSNVEKVTRRSKRLESNVKVLVFENVKAVERDDLEVKKAPRQCRQLRKSVNEHLVGGQAQKGDKQPKRTSENDLKAKQLLRCSKRTAVDNMVGQVRNTSPKRDLVIERDGPSVDNVEKLNVDDEVQVRVRFTRNSSKHGSYKAPIVVEGSLVEKKKDETLDALVSSKRGFRRMKRDRSAEPGMGIETTSTQRNLTPEKLLDELAQTELERVGNATEKTRDSSKKSKKMNQAGSKDKLPGTSENSPSSSKIKGTESLMIAENVLDSILERSFNNRQRSNTQESNSEFMGREFEEEFGRDTVLMAAIEKDKEEVPPASALLAVSNPEAELVVSTGHILITGISSTVTVEENIKTKGETLIFTPRPESEEHSSAAKSANAEVLENSAVCWKKVHSSNCAEKGSLEKDEHAANLHEHFSECNTENSCAKEEMEITQVGGLSVGHCGILTPEKLLDKYTQLEPEARVSSLKMNTVNQEFTKDNPQGMTEDTPSISETKATKAVMQSEVVMDSTPKVSVDISSERDTQEVNSELMEGKREDKHEKDTVLMATSKMDQEEASSLSAFLIESSEVKKCAENHSTGGYLSVEATLPPVSVQLPRSNPEAEPGIPTGHILVNDIVSTVIPEETLICTPRTELEEHSSIASLAIVEEIHSSKDDDKGSSEKDLQAASSHENYSGYNTENSSAADGMEMCKVGCMSVRHYVNLTEEKLLDAYTQLDPEEAGGSHVEARDSSFKDRPRGMVEDSPLTGPIRMTENVWDSTPKCTGDIPMVKKAQELNDEPMEGEHEREQEQETIMVAVTKVKEDASSLSVSLIESSEAEVCAEVTPSASVQLAVSDQKTKEDILISIPRSELQEHDIVAKLAEAEAECWNEDHSSKDDEKVSLENDIQAGNTQGNFSEYDVENRSETEKEETSKVCQISAGHCVNMETLDEVKDENLEISERPVSSFRGCKLNPLEQTGWSLTDFSSVSPNEENTSAEKHLQLETDKESKGDNLSANYHAFTAAKSHSLMEESDAYEEEQKYRESKDVESSIFTNLERHSLSEDFGLDKTRKIRDHTATCCQESFVFTFPERQQFLGNSEPCNAGEQEQKEMESKDESVFFSRTEDDLRLIESGQDRLDIGNSDLSQFQSHHASSPKAILKDDSVVPESRTASKVSCNHEFNVRQEPADAEVTPKGSQADDVSGLDTTQGTLKGSRGHCPVFNFGNEGEETIMKAESNVSLSSYVLALPAVGYYETIGEISNPLQVAETCSMVSEESSPSADIQNKINDALEELAMTENNGACKLMEEKVTKNTPRAYEENLTLDSSDGSGKTYVVAETVDEHANFDSEVDFKNTCEKSSPKFLEDEATVPIATAFDKAIISLTPEDFTVDNNKNEKAANEEMIIRETTPSPEETLNEPSQKEYLNEKEIVAEEKIVTRETTPSPESPLKESSSVNRKEHFNIDESGTFSGKQVRREPLLIYGTQMKPKMHDMKENAPNSKIVDNLNVTALRTSKRQPLQDLKKN